MWSSKRLFIKKIIIVTSERGTQAEAYCERNLNYQLWSIRQLIKGELQSVFVILFFVFFIGQLSMQF